jgi:hypothetical protein
MILSPKGFWATRKASKAPWYEAHAKSMCQVKTLKFAIGTLCNNNPIVATPISEDL